MSTEISAPLAQHLVLRLKNDQVIAPDPSDRRLLVRTVLRVGRNDPILGFGLPDNHLHVEVMGSRPEAMWLAQRLGGSLRRQLGLKVGFAPSRAKPILDARHLRRALRYILCQPVRHRILSDPDREGTSLPDLLGLRPLGAHTPDIVRRWLPRLTRQDLLDWANAGPLLSPHVGIRDLWEATLAAAARMDLGGSDQETLTVRCALVHLAAGHATASQLAAPLRASIRTIHRLRARTPDPVWLDAIRRQLTWRARPRRVPQPRGAFALPAASDHRRASLDVSTPTDSTETKSLSSALANPWSFGEGQS